MAWIPPGTYRLGSDVHYPEERPAHFATLAGFWIEKHAVTNARFAAFVQATEYVTIAERPLHPAEHPGLDASLLQPGGLVFRPTSGPVDLRNVTAWWHFVPGANWRHPEGPASTIAGRPDHPVVQVAFEDAQAYATWCDRALPTEPEWEAAARGGLDAAEYVWGNEFNPGGTHLANTWQGAFPHQNLAADGYAGTSPVGAYPPNGYGLYDMAGNVWNWTTDWYSTGPAPHACCAPAQPAIRAGCKVIKGGSFLCAPDYCRRYRPAARHPQLMDTPTCHIGFRCVVRRKEALLF
jgi:formylglycine-generating enzyme required for sulfatase activity